MKKEQLKKVTQETEQNLNEMQKQVKNEVLKFNTVEELIRYDLNKVELPETLWDRIRKSISGIPASVPFWKRLFKKQ